MTITLSTLHQATPQQVYDQVVEHLRKQGQQSLDDGNCAYRGENGLMCAAGCLIADTEYEPIMDSRANSSWEAIANDGIVPQHHSSLIQDLQAVHDNFVRTWEGGLAQVARLFNLEYKAP